MQVQETIRYDTEKAQPALAEVTYKAVVKLHKSSLKTVTSLPSFRSCRLLCLMCTYCT